MKTKTLFIENWPNPRHWRAWLGRAKVVVVADQKLQSIVRRELAANGEIIFVAGGEELKSMRGLVDLAEEVLGRVQGESASQIVLIAVGGGTIGDAVGFLASVLKRGVRLIHVPTTYLAAVDSAHGGKTAINISGYKNQIGTFYSAERVVVIQKVLSTQPDVNLRSAYGELIKISLLEGGRIFARLRKAKVFDVKLFWQLLPAAVEAKQKIVTRDPYEKTGERQKLNLGHTLGHAIEVEQKWPHGLAVLSGLEFSLELSRRLKILSDPDYEVIRNVVNKNLSGLRLNRPMISSKNLERLLARDKKALKRDRVRFVLVAKPGRPFVKELRINEVIRAAKDLGWAR